MWFFSECNARFRNFRERTGRKSGSGQRSRHKQISAAKFPAVFSGAILFHEDTPEDWADSIALSSRPSRFLKENKIV